MYRAAGVPVIASDLPGTRFVGKRDVGSWKFRAGHASPGHRRHRPPLRRDFDELPRSGSAVLLSGERRSLPRLPRPVTKGSLKIAILEMREDDPTATGARGRAMTQFLRAGGHAVEVLTPSSSSIEEFARTRFSIWTRLKRRAFRRRNLPHLWDHLADELEPRLRAGRFDAIIGRMPPVAYVLTRQLGAMSIF